MEFNKAYNRQEFMQFLQNNFLPDDFIPANESVTFTTQMNYSSEAVKLGSSETLDLVVYEIKHTSRNDARVTLSKEAFRMLADEMEDRALVVFVPADNCDNYRFSFIEITLDLAEDSSRVSRKYSNPRRYSYLLGKGIAYYTPNKYLNEKGRVVNDEDLHSRFSVEVLTKEFYKDLFNWYIWAIDSKTEVTFPNNTTTQEDDREQIDTKIIRLITRLMFVWFIKQKELIPNAIFDEQQLKDILKNFDPQSADNGNYYNAILQNLFFATLNRAITDEDNQPRGFAKGEGKDLKTLYRYAEMFAIPENEVIQLFADVPFLNGGLFECLDKTKTIDGVEKAYNFDGFSRNDSTFANGKFRNRAFIPNQLFFESEKGLLSILKRYNFTIEENTPFDQEVSLDPELLGKVFENLLGVYNNEAKETARNQTGSFYTPREIVNYMIDESLIAYLGDTPFNRSIFADNFEKDELHWSDYQAIAGKLKSLKILDPACGSGAFPMGLLNRVVDILKRIGTDESDYNLKLNLIENCIYGVDIQPIATQISKLRFFISLICDCERDETKPNFGIPTLPNLETKFVCANTLFDSKLKKYNDDWTTDETLVQYKNDLLKIRHEHFQAKTANEKKKLRKNDETVSQKIRNYIIDRATKPDEEKIAWWQNQIDKDQLNLQKYQGERWVEKMRPQSGNLFENPEPTLVRYDGNKEKRDEINKRIKACQSKIENEKNKTNLQGFADAVEQVTHWNPYDQNDISPFFDSEWMFGVKDGFDIVIGNPPYVSTKRVEEGDKKVLEREFGFADDTYNHFFFKGVQLLCTNGTLTYITPKTFWTTQTKRNLRNLILSKQINYIFDTANPFKAAMVDTCITSISNKNEINNEIRFLDGSKDLSNPLKYTVSQEVYRNTQNSVIFKPTPENMRIYEKFGQKVKELYDKWWDKIKTSRDIEKNKVELENYRKNLKPGDVALLGCLTEGGQGLATANNGKYIAVRKSTKWAKNIIESRPKKLAEAIQKKKIKLQGLEQFSNTVDFLASLSEIEITELFDNLKEKYGRDIFGQGYIYRLVDDSEMADVDKLTQNEKDNGIDTTKNFYVPYDKGDKDGNRWYLETPFAIAWSKENVRFLKTNSGKKGEGMPVVRNPQFYFREGLCWSDINTTFLKCRLKEKSINDVKSMSIFPLFDFVPINFIICLINSTFMSYYVDNFVNNTQTFQINDARQLPIIVPTNEILTIVENFFNNAFALKKQQFKNVISNSEAEQKLNNIQEALDVMVRKLYGLK
ncbi:MAG: Eco57I restriction-modification methylase domain-containing protein [Bacteroidales bacterium]|nr:Eco57I restriction-modification methylase domain-containing protein [Bacteroidales bacterium]